MTPHEENIKRIKQLKDALYSLRDLYYLAEEKANDEYMLGRICKDYSKVFEILEELGLKLKTGETK